MPDIPNFDDWAKSTSTRAPRGNYDPLIEKHAADNGIDPNLMRAIMGRESSGNPNAVSPKGARGLMQLMPGTAARFGTTDIHDPDQNIRGGARYLKFLSDKFNGNPDLVIAGYNAGEGAVQKYGNKIPPYAETQAYVPAVKARYARLTGQQPQTTQSIPTFDDWATKAPAEIPHFDNWQGQQLTQQVAQPAQPKPAVRPRQPGYEGTGTIGQGVKTAPVRAAQQGMAGANVSGMARSQSTILRNKLGSIADPFGVAPPDPEVEAAQKVEAQKNYDRMLTTNVAEVNRVKAETRKQIQSQGGWTPNVDKWLAETVSRGESHFNELLAGAARPLSTQAYNNLWSRAEGIRQAVEEESQGRSTTSKWAQGTLAGLVSPEMAAAALHVPPEVAFGGGAGLSSLGRGESPAQAAQATRLGATEGALFRGPAIGGNVVARTLTKAGTVGAGTYALTGDPVAAASNAAFAASGPLLHGEGARPAPELAEAVPASKPREFAPTLAPSELAKRTALREGNYERPVGSTEEGIPQAPVAEPAAEEPHYSTRQNRRVRKLASGAKPGQFKKGFKPEVPDVTATEPATPDLQERSNAPLIKPATSPAEQPPVAAQPVPSPAETTAPVPETKPSRLAQGVEAKAIAAKLTEGFPDLPEYNTITVKDQAERALKLLNDDPELAKRVAVGTEQPPQGLHPESVFVALENRALQNGDVQTIQDLAQGSRSGEASVMGQRIRLLGERNPYSPVKAIADIEKARSAGVSDEQMKSATNRVKTEVGVELKKAAPKVDAWQKFLNEIVCK